MDFKKLLEKYVPYNEQEENDKKMMLKYIDTFEDVLTRENKMCHFTASSWIVNKERTKVLMIYHKIYDSWAWTGGHCDGDSDMLHVALKEASEETGVENFKVLNNNEIYSIEIVSVNGHVKRGKYVPTHLHLNISYLLEADEHATLRIKEDENSGVKWVDISEVNNIVTERDIKIIYDKLNKKLIEEKL